MQETAAARPVPSDPTDFAGRPIVVAVVPGQPALVARTAAALARATGAPALYLAYVDPSRYPEEEYADGTVRHVAMDPGLADDGWTRTEQVLREEISQALAGAGIPWELRYLAGRADRALVHLARSVGAAAFVVGARVGHHRWLSDFMNGSVSTHLAHRQHHPVLAVPYEDVEGMARASDG